MSSKRYQVFVSSTYLDLHEERQEIIRALLELDCIPAGMELFPAADEDAWTLIRRVIDESDYYLIVTAGKYGSVHPDTGISYTEMEYDYAVEVGKPCVGFIHQNLASLPSGNVDPDGESRSKLAAFHEKVKRKVVKMWSSSEQLAAVVSRSVVQLQKQHPAVGWVRADQVDRSVETLMISKLKADLAERDAAILELRAAPEAAENAGQIIQERSGYDPVLKYLRTVGKPNGWETLYQILAAVQRAPRGSGATSYTKFDHCAYVASRETGLSQSIVENVLFLLVENGLVIVDHADDLFVVGEFLTTLRYTKLKSDFESRGFEYNAAK